ncbi:MAG TPA: patatin-like phospholipase family protein [Candidatus Dormibacteraeota bacterium]|nr:patatin-like phospholipase family protein [Candidatus Dormibacteraeota bacterium]
MRVGLVLGAGGVMGGAWITGGLQALANATGWDPATADYIVGTSAGSMMGALLASGVPPWFMVAHSQGESFDGLVDSEGRPAGTADRSGGARYTLHRAWPRMLLGSPELARRLLSNPRSLPPIGSLVALGPRGFISTEPLKDVVRRVVPSGWAPHPNFWAVAADYATLERVAFGSPSAPHANLADAVAASCAVPGFYHPVEIAGRRYLDGGVYSVSNIDVLKDEKLDLVICLNPMSSRHRPHGLKPTARVGALIRSGAGRRLAREARTLREGGTEVVLLQPTARDLRIMGNNYMSGRRRNEVIQTAIETVTEQVRQADNWTLLRDLPAGQPYRLRRPEGIPESEWPDLIGIGAGPQKRSA